MRSTGAPSDAACVSDPPAISAPEMTFDLPAGGKRLVQRAEGYRHTFVAGVETRCGDEATGAVPGRLIRGARPRAA